MSEKRRDNRGRLLRVGESQRADGRYEFKFTDSGGIRRTIYSWRLVGTDKAPPNKKETAPLREMEDKILRDLQDSINSFGLAHTTVDEYWRLYIEGRFELKATTRNQYEYQYSKFVSPCIGNKSLVKVRYDDIRRMYVGMLERGVKAGTVRVIQGTIYQMFDAAVKNRYIRLNPTDGVVKDLKRSCSWEYGRRSALTVQEQSALVDFVSSSAQFSRWPVLFTVLLGTGMRIGECLALRWDDIDFQKNVINVWHTLTYCKHRGETKRTPHIDTPKTRSSVRSIPMLAEVRLALLREKEYQMAHGATITKIDQYSNFIFQTQTRHAMLPSYAHGVIKRVVAAYNATHKDNPLPEISAHHLRHTFCTRFCENESNIKVIQEIMGHGSAKTTMDIYAQATMEKKAEVFDNLEGKMKIG